MTWYSTTGMAPAPLLLLELEHSLNLFTEICTSSFLVPLLRVQNDSSFIDDDNMDYLPSIPYPAPAHSQALLAFVMLLLLICYVTLHLHSSSTPNGRARDKEERNERRKMRLMVCTVSSDREERKTDHDKSEDRLHCFTSQPANE